MNCQYLIGICSKTRLPCPHCGVDGKCDDAECTNAVVPTWKELVDIYATAVKPTRQRLGNIRTSLASLTRILGTTMDAKVAVTDEQMDEAYAKLLEKYEPETISSIFDSYKATTSTRRREIKLEYRKRGKQAPDIDFPTVEKKAKPVVQLTDEQRLAVREKMLTLRGSKQRADRTRFLWLFFAWEFGVRPVDIGRLTWANIVVHSNGSTWLDYVPRKTARIGKHAGGKLTDDQLAMLKPFIGNADERVIPLDESKRPKKGASKIKCGEYIAHHQSLRSYFVAFMRSIGVADRKPQYALRKDCSQQTIKTKGVLHEAQLLGHTPKVAMTNYTDISKIDLKEGL